MLSFAPLLGGFNSSKAQGFADLEIYVQKR
jgi:hypothetical protein